ncbi:MAG: efflux RND transporter periplasmic adaptor subunit [Thermodesulfovibrionales bacterium]
MRKKTFLILVFSMLLIAICLIFFVGCKKSESKPPPEKTINVFTQPAEKKSLRPFIETIGTLNPNEEVIVSSEVDGILRNVTVDEGAEVAKGKALAVIDDIDYSLEVQRAEAALKQTEATLSNTKLEYGRKESLYKEQLVTQQQFDDVSTRLALAEAEVERAKAYLSLARQKHSKTKISSPLPGVVKEKKVEKGNFVKTGTPLFTIIQTNPLKLNFTVNEKDLAGLKTGQEALFKVDAFPDKEFKSTLTIIYPSLEERTRTLQVEAKAPNRDGKLKPGLFAHVTVYTGSARDVIIVPATSLLYEGERIKVFIVEGNTAKERYVKVGRKYKFDSTAKSSEPAGREYAEIIEGVKEGESVVTVGQQGLFDGAKITVSKQ